MQYQRQINCPKCGLQSCSQCKRAYHGEVECEDNPIFEPRRNNIKDFIVSDLQNEEEKQQEPLRSKQRQLAQTEKPEPEVSHCPLCHSRNLGVVPKNWAKGERPSVVHTCFFCSYVYCACCGDDASQIADHFGYFSQTACNFDQKGVYKRPTKQQNEEGCGKKTLKTIAYLFLILLSYPFVLVFTCMILGPYIMQRRGESSCAKIGLAFLGFLLGLLVTPLFIAAGTLWTIFWFIMELLDLCGCTDCDCFSMNPGGNYYNQ